MNRPALFLDRDGVINEDREYVHLPEQVEFIDGVFDLVAGANRAGRLVVVVTNQAGIGRGFYLESQFLALTKWMKARFAERGGRIDAVYFCPYHPEYGVGPYRRESEFRKPAPGMLLQAQRELGIDMQRSILIGDKLSDIAAGRAAGVGTLLHFRGENVGNEANVITRLSEAMRFMMPPLR